MSREEDMQDVIGRMNEAVAPSEQKKKYFQKGKFLHSDLAEDIVDEYHIIGLNDKPYIYAKGIYVDNRKKIENLIRKKDKLLSIKQRAEVLADIELICSENEKKEAPFTSFAFDNGILDLENSDLEIQDFDTKVILTSRVNAEYIKSDSNAVVDQFMDEVTCHSKEREELIYAVIGYACSRTAIFHKSFIFRGKRTQWQKHIM